MYVNGVSRGILFTLLYPLFFYIPLCYNEVRVYLYFIGAIIVHNALCKVRNE